TSTLQSQAGSRTEETAQQLNRSESFSLKMHAISGMSGEGGVAAEISGQKSEVRNQRPDVRLSHVVKAGMKGLRSEIKANHAIRPEVRSQRSEVRNLAATSSAPLVPTPIGSFPINGTGTGFTLPAGKTTTIT